jgi:hypothetical protein
MRVYEPQGEDFFSQVRICTVNGLRTANFIPPINIGDYRLPRSAGLMSPRSWMARHRWYASADHELPATRLCCVRVPEVALGDGVVLQE